MRGRKGNYNYFALSLGDDDGIRKIFVRVEDMPYDEFKKYVDKSPSGFVAAHASYDILPIDEKDWETAYIVPTEIYGIVDITDLANNVFAEL